MSELKHVEGRVIISVDTEAKNWHTFTNGTKIRRERQFNELNRRITEPVNAIVVSGENIPTGTEILIHPNVVHDSNRIFNHTQLSGKVEGSDIKYYSAKEEYCYAYLEDGEWRPMKGFDFALRVFKPHTGLIQGIEPEQLKNILFVTTGELKDKAVLTIKASDYEIIFQNTSGREGRLIRFRPFGCEKTEREPEAIAIMNDVTEKIINGEYLAGLTPSDAKEYEITAYAD